MKPINQPSGDRDLEGLIADLEDCSGLEGAAGYETVTFDRAKARQLITDFLARRARSGESSP